MVDKMNKYHEAIKWIEDIFDIMGGKFVGDHRKALQELVDMRENALVWCNSVLNSQYEICTFPDGTEGDTGYCIQLAKPLFEILKGEKK